MMNYERVANLKQILFALCGYRRLATLSEKIIHNRVNFDDAVTKPKEKTYINKCWGLSI
jgi:hypothetical protein